MSGWRDVWQRVVAPIDETMRDDASATCPIAARETGGRFYCTRAPGHAGPCAAVPTKEHFDVLFANSIAGKVEAAVQERTAHARETIAELKAVNAALVTDLREERRRNARLAEIIADMKMAGGASGPAPQTGDLATPPPRDLTVDLPQVIVDAVIARSPTPQMRMHNMGAARRRFMALSVDDRQDERNVQKIAQDILDGASPR